MVIRFKLKLCFADCMRMQIALPINFNNAFVPGGIAYMTCAALIQAVAEDPAIPCADDHFRLVRSDCFRRGFYLKLNPLILVVIGSDLDLRKADRHALEQAVRCYRRNLLVQGTEAYRAIASTVQLIAQLQFFIQADHLPRGHKAHAGRRILDRNCVAGGNSIMRGGCNGRLACAPGRNKTASIDACNLRIAGLILDRSNSHSRCYGRQQLQLFTDTDGCAVCAQLNFFRCRYDRYIDRCGYVVIAFKGNPGFAHGMRHQLACSINIRKPWRVGSKANRTGAAFIQAVAKRIAVPCADDDFRRNRRYTFRCSFNLELDSLILVVVGSDLDLRKADSYALEQAVRCYRRDFLIQGLEASPAGASRIQLIAKLELFINA